METLSAEKRALLSLKDGEIRALFKLAAQKHGVPMTEGNGKMEIPDNVKGKRQT